MILFIILMREFMEYLSFLFESDLVYKIHSVKKKSNEKKSKIYRSTLFGPTCDSKDLITPSINLPKLDLNDIIYILQMLDHIQVFVLQHLMDFLFKNIILFINIKSFFLGHFIYFIIILFNNF